MRSTRSREVQHLRELMDERDRRYAEVNQEREKALRIQAEGDQKALVLAREIQTYKDEKANELRSQIEQERGTYVTHLEMKPVFDYVASQTGRSSGLHAGWGYLAGIAGLVMAVLGLVLR